ncbi:MAG: hypothetical protein ACTTJ9_02460 [Segatella oris]
MNEKREKEAFPHGENQKSAKIGFPPRGKTRNQRKSTFRHGGKSKIGEN